MPVSEATLEGPLSGPASLGDQPPDPGRAGGGQDSAADDAGGISDAENLLDAALEEAKNPGQKRDDRDRDRGKDRDRDRDRKSRSRDRKDRDKDRDRKSRSRDKDKRSRSRRDRDREKRSRSRRGDRDRSDRDRDRKRSRSRRGRNRGAISPESMPHRARALEDRSRGGGSGGGSGPSGEKPEGFREGDWMCPRCNFHNYRSKNTCGGCGAPKQAEGTVSIVRDGPRRADNEGSAKRRSTKWGEPPEGVPEWLCDLVPQPPPEENTPKPPPGVAADKFKILKLDGRQIRALIGKGGQTIRDIRLMSGADVKINHLPTESEGLVNIVGDIEKTMVMIKQALVDQGCPMGVERKPPKACPPPGGATGNAQGDIAIPVELVGPLIGPGGSVIKSLREAAGGACFISVMPSTTLGGPQCVRIVGENREQARLLVLEKIEELKKQLTATPAAPGQLPVSTSYDPDAPRRPLALTGPSTPALRPHPGLAGLLRPQLGAAAHLSGPGAQLGGLGAGTQHGGAPAQFGGLGAAALGVANAQLGGAGTPTGMSPGTLRLPSTVLSAGIRPRPTILGGAQLGMGGILGNMGRPPIGIAGGSTRALLLASMGRGPAAPAIGPGVPPGAAAFSPAASQAAPPASGSCAMGGATAKSHPAGSFATGELGLL